MLCSDAVKALKKELPKELTKAAFKRFRRAAQIRQADVRGEDVVILSAVRDTGKSSRSPALARLDRDVTRDDRMDLDRAAMAKSEP
jgi:hypothetical protein